MKAIFSSLGALLIVAAIVSLAEAQPCCSPYVPYFPPPAPDACGPGYFVANGCGMVYGPNYWVLPPWGPFQGARPPLRKPQGSGGGPPGCPPPPVFPTHPYARSPRDYFMTYEDRNDPVPLRPGNNLR